MDDKDNKPAESKLPLFNKIRLSETLILASFPIMAYLLIFTYFSGYFSVFKLPIQFISFDLVSVFFVSGILLGLAFMIYYWGDMIFHIFRHLPKPLRSRFERFSMATFGYIVFWYLYDKLFNDWRDQLILILGIVIIGLLEFGSPILLLTNRKAYLAKLESDDERKDAIRKQQEKNREWETSIDRLIRIAPEIFIFFIVLALVYAAGRYTAIRQTEYRVVNTAPERVVLWDTNEYAICVLFNRLTHEVEQSYIVLKIGDNPQIEYSLEELGRLKLKSPSPSQTNIPTSSPTLSLSIVTQTPVLTMTPTLTASPVLAATPSITPTPRIVQTAPSSVNTP
jgi:hypothetical protein